jgi:RNA polymerase sigma-70 factor (ECF subfamily)
VDPQVELNLVERLRGGDATALETLMDRYGSRVYRLAYGVTRNDADAKEVAQDVFLNLFRKIDTFEGRAALGTWIYRVTLNAAMIKQRGKRFEVEVPLLEQLPRFLADGHREGHSALVREDWSRTPEEELLSLETRTILNRAIEELPDHYRGVLVLRDVEGLSNEEVAEALGDSVGSVKSRLHRARMVLREQLTRYLRPGQAGEGRKGADHAHV